MIAISAAAPSTIAASTTWPLPERARSSSAARIPYASIMPPPPKSPTRLSGGGGGESARPIACERAGERDVVEIVTGGLRERTVLAPARHAPEHEPRIAREADVGTEAESLHHAGPEALDQRVGLLDEAQHHLDAGGTLEIHARRCAGRGSANPDWDRPAGAARARSARSTRSTSAPRSASIIAANGPGPDARDLDDANPIQGSHGCLLDRAAAAKGRGG